MTQSILQFGTINTSIRDAASVFRAGFIEPDEGNIDIHFHQLAYVPAEGIDCTGLEPVFPTGRYGHWELPKVPEVNDRIVFLSWSDLHSGPTATRWCFATDWLEAERTLVDRYVPVEAMPTFAKMIDCLKAAKEVGTKVWDVELSAERTQNTIAFLEAKRTAHDNAQRAVEMGADPHYVMNLLYRNAPWHDLLTLIPA